MKVFFFGGLLLWMIVVANLILWIIAASHEISFPEAKTVYLNYFPAFLRNAILLTFINIGLSLLSIYFLQRSQNLPTVYYRRIGQLVMMLNSLLIGWQVFSLM